MGPDASCVGLCSEALVVFATGLFADAVELVNEPGEGVFVCSAEAGRTLLKNLMLRHVRVDNFRQRNQPYVSGCLCRFGNSLVEFDADLPPHVYGLQQEKLQHLRLAAVFQNSLHISLYRGYWVAIGRGCFRGQFLLTRLTS